MSFPNNGQQGSGTSSNPAFNPALLNANAALANFNLNSGASGNPALNPNLPPAVQQQISNFNPAQLARLTEFHRQIPQQAQQQQQQQQQQPIAAAPGPPRPPRVQFSVPQNVRDILNSTNMTAEQKNDFLQRWLKTEEGRQATLQHRQATAAHAALAAGSAGGAPIRPTGVNPSNLTTGSPAARLSSFVSPQFYANALPAVGSSGAADVSTSSTRPPNPDGQPSHILPTTHQKYNSATILPSGSQPQSSAAGPSTVRPPPQQQNRPPSAFYAAHPSVPAGWDAPARRPTSPEPVVVTMAPRAPPAPRRREEGMRGTMRSELARLMYASGDVENPDLDTIDYMEDLVVDWLADLCAPPPPIRSNASAPLVAPRLDYNIIRHRLSRPSMRKYLDRFEYMEYKAIDMRSARRVARGNFEPVDQKDLDKQLEKGFLDAEDSGKVDPNGTAGVAGQVRKKRKYTRQAPTAGAAGAGEDGAGRERKKPGPKKGWKAGQGETKARKIKRARQSTGPSVPSGRGSSVKPEE